MIVTTNERLTAIVFLIRRSVVLYLQLADHSRTDSTEAQFACTIFVHIYLKYRCIDI